MIKATVLLTLFTFLQADWIMHGENPSFIYNTKTGEVFRYFEQDNHTGFMKLNYHKYFQLKHKSSKNTNSSNTPNSQLLDIKKLQQTLINKSLTEVLK